MQEVYEDSKRIRGEHRWAAEEVTRELKEFRRDLQEMKEQMYDEELIEAFKFFGAKNDRDGFTKE